MRRSFLPGIVMIILLLSFSRPIQADLVTSDIWVNAGSAAYSDETSMTTSYSTSFYLQLYWCKFLYYPAN